MIYVIRCTYYSQDLTIYVLSQLHLSNYTYFIECQAGNFGLNCKQRCGMCQDGDVCDIYTGECPSGCTDEYKGSQCSQEINQDTSSSSDTSISLPVFIGSLIAVIVVNTTIVIGLVSLFYRKRLNKKGQ